MTETAETTHGLPHLSVHETTIGRGEVLLNGVDVSDQVLGVDLAIRAGDITQAVLLLRPGTTAGFEGYARVAVGEPHDPGPAAAHFLAAISAEELEKAALARNDLGNGPSELTKAMLRQLQDWAHGRS